MVSTHSSSDMKVTTGGRGLERAAGARQMGLRARLVNASGVGRRGGDQVWLSRV